MNAVFRQANRCFVASILFFATLVQASESEPRAQLLKGQIDQAKETIAQWNSDAVWLIALITIVGVLGAAIALLQQLGAKKRWCSVSIAVVGFSISALTIFTNNFFDADHKTYRKQAHMAGRYITEAEQHLKLLKIESDVANRQALVKIISEKIARFQELQDKLLDTPKSASALTLISTVHAQGLPRPAWTSQQKTESATAYRFAGVGVDQSLPEAQTRSLQDAQRNASNLLSIPVGSVQRFARIVDTYSEYDASQRTYRHYTLLELNKALAR